MRERKQSIVNLALHREQHCALEYKQGTGGVTEVNVFNTFPITPSLSLAVFSD
jgi:hypothetical protein